MAKKLPVAKAKSTAAKTGVTKKATAKTKVKGKARQPAVVKKPVFALAGQNA